MRLRCHNEIIFMQLPKDMTPPLECYLLPFGDNERKEILFFGDRAHLFHQMSWKQTALQNTYIKMVIEFRPVCLDLYRARSTLLSKRPRSAVSRVTSVMPMLIVT